MRRERIGELLSRMARLSGQDIEEILDQQRLSRRPFGEIALAWGLCTPQQLWRAWTRQLTGSGARVDLDRTGIDAQAAACLSAESAHRFQVVPIRLLDGVLLVAAADPGVAADELIRRASPVVKHVQLVAADPAQIRRTIARYYGPPGGSPERK